MVSGVPSVVELERVLGRPGPNPTLWYCQQCASVAIVLFGIAAKCPQCASVVEEVPKERATALMALLLGDAELTAGYAELAESAILDRLTTRQRDSIGAVLAAVRSVQAREFHVRTDGGGETHTRDG